MATAKAKKPKLDWPAQFRWKIYVQSIALTPDAIFVANSSYLRLGMLRRGTKTPEELEMRGSPQSLSLSPDSSEIAFAYGGYQDTDGKSVPAGIFIADTKTGAERTNLSGIAKDPQWLAWSPDGEHFAVISYPERLDVYRVEDVRKGKKKPRATVKLEGDGAVFFENDSSLTLYGSEKTWSITPDGKTSTSARARTNGRVEARAPDGALAFCTGVVSAKGKHLWEQRDERYAQGVEFSSDGSRLVCAAASWDFLEGKKSACKRARDVAYVVIHDAETGKELAWKERPVKREVRALAVNDEVIVIGRDSGCDLFTWSELGVQPKS